MKERIDVVLVDRGLVESRTKAQWLIMNGYVVINGKKITKPGKRVDDSLEIHLLKKFPYVGRGGLKLESALKFFSISVKDKVCADIGASVGGFTDCLIKSGARKVYAIDTAIDLLHPLLRIEKMKKIVIPMVGVDARNKIEMEEKIDVCTIDTTFTSLREILPNVKNFLRKKGIIIALIKPLFETQFQKEKKFKIIRDSRILSNILKELIEWSIKNNIFPYGIKSSPLLGKGGSIEFLIYYKIHKKDNKFDYKKAIKEIL
ncbi:MAG: TlyA family RNA methyltransferase [Promethearchaeota archaeon]